VSEDIRHALLF